MRTAAPPGSAITPPAAPAHYATIDALRGVAAVMVFGFHLNEKVPAATGPGLDFWRSAWKHGYLGVPLFFVISGVCVTLSWLREPGAGEFLHHRLRRIFPPYWASLAVVVALALGVKVLTGVNDVAPLPQTASAILATLVLATRPVTDVPVVNWVYWSLSFEVAFYAVLAAVLLAPRTQRLLLLAAVHTVFCLLAAFLPSPALRPFFFIELWPLFGTGAALVLWRRDRRIAAVMGLASGVHLTLCLTQGRHEALWLTAGLGVTVCAAALAGRGLLGASPLVYLGKVSYSIYLIHVPVAMGLIGRLLPSFGRSAAAEIAWQVVVFLATLAVVQAFFLLAERPFLRSHRPK